MNDEIALISDGDGLAVIGKPMAVDRFLVSEGLTAKDLGLPRLKSVLRAGSGAAEVASRVAAESGRWLKLTKESAHLVKKHGLMDSKTPGVSHVMVGQPGVIKSWLQASKGSPVGNPAFLAGAAGIMAQLAMQQTMDEITDYLAVIDEKVDDVLRAQQDTVLARMIGVALVIEETMTIRQTRGRVDEITWSKVQTAPTTVAETQAYALRQLDALAEKLEKKTNVGDLAKAAREAESKGQEWLAVLARCFQLQDAIAVLELDRVLDASPEELDGHRMGLKAARKNRMELISKCTGRLVARMDAAVDRANTKVLLHPFDAPAIVHASNHVAGAIVDFNGRLGIEAARESAEARQWMDAAKEARDKALETGAEGVGVAMRFGNDSFDLARSAAGTLSSRLTERALRWRGDERNQED